MGAPRKFNGELRRQIAEAYASDETIPSIRRRFGCDTTTIKRIAAEHGVLFKRARNKRQQIIKLSLAEPTLGSEEIAARLNVSVKYAREVRRVCGLSQTPNVDPANDRADMRAVQEVRP